MALELYTISPAASRDVEPFDDKYDLALSFAGEDRAYVQQVAQHLDEAGANVFYDEKYIRGTWGSYFQILDIIPAGHFYQDVVLLSKPLASTS